MLTQREVLKYRRKRNGYIELHRLPSGNLLITANRDCRKDLRALKADESEGAFSSDQQMHELLSDFVYNQGWEWMDDTVSCWGGPVIGEWGPTRLLTERETNYLHGECMGDDRSMYWLRFESAIVVRDQVLFFQYEPYAVRSTLDDLLEYGHSVWHCGCDLAQDPGPTESDYQPMLFNQADLPPVVNLGIDTDTYHGAVPACLQVEETAQGWALCGTP